MNNDTGDILFIYAKAGIVAMTLRRLQINITFRTLLLSVLVDSSDTKTHSRQLLL